MLNFGLGGETNYLTEGTSDLMSIASKQIFLYSLTSKLRLDEPSHTDFGTYMRLQILANYGPIVGSVVQEFLTTVMD